METTWRGDVEKRLATDHSSVVWGQSFSRHATSMSSTPIDRWALARITRMAPGASVNFRLWDGFRLSPSGASVAGTITFRNRRALFSWLWDPELNVGETYMFGAVEIDGDLPAVLAEVYRAPGREVRSRRWPSPSDNDAKAARDNVHHHYDLGNAFYERWLDSEMLYTCAYFPTPAASLDAAQIAKMDRICRKLALRPGERVLEAGCGWGGLARYMARHYGVTVRALNVSSEQIAYARERARAERIDDRVEFVEDDYRNVRGRYDAVVSVGMLEHVGAAQYGALGEVLDRSLTSDGRGLLHFIGRTRPSPLNRWIRRRIFPGAYPPTLAEVFDAVLAPSDLSVIDVENLRLHYAVTLQHWCARFETAADAVATMFDEAFVRAWRLYLAGSQAAFTTGAMQLFQVVFARGRSNAIPWTRLD
jgi:cyclopropane-fatty-acyl-phospholipid synthase